MTSLRLGTLLFVASAILAACGGPRRERAEAPPAPARTLPPPPPGPPAPPPAPVPELVVEVSSLLQQTHPDLLDSLAGLSERVAAAARAPQRDPVRAEHLGRALDGKVVLALLTRRLADDPTAASMQTMREWLAGADGRAFVAARKYAIEARREKHNLAGPSLERRHACRRMIQALGDGRFAGRLEFGLVTQTFLGPGMGVASRVGDAHKNLIAQGPWLLERAGDLGIATSEWPLASIEGVTAFWESPVARDWVDAIDRHLGEILEQRLAEAERTVPTH